eukprot:Em0208g3a
MGIRTESMWIRNRAGAQNGVVTAVEESSAVEMAAKGATAMTPKIVTPSDDTKDVAPSDDTKDVTPSGDTKDVGPSDDTKDCNTLR